MLEIIAIIIFLISVGGIALIIYRKIPLLLQLPKTKEVSQPEDSFVLQLKESAKEMIPDKKNLQKILSKIRILTLKAEKFIDTILQKLRKKSP